jgi:1-deoxy-D-xylulose-5-phosphate reductoisomerase
VVNAANEECVDAFHERRISFTAIIDIVTAVLAEHLSGPSTGSGGGAADSGSAPRAELVEAPDPSTSSGGGAAGSGSVGIADIGSRLVTADALTLEAVLAADAWARRQAAALAAGDPRYRVGTRKDQE